MQNNNVFLHTDVFFFIMRLSRKCEIFVFAVFAAYDQASIHRCQLTYVRWRYVHRCQTQVFFWKHPIWTYVHRCPPGNVRFLEIEAEIAWTLAAHRHAGVGTSLLKPQDLLAGHFKQTAARLCESRTRKVLLSVVLATERQHHHSNGVLESPDVADVSLCPKELRSQKSRPMSMRSTLFLICWLASLRHVTTFSQIGWSLHTTQGQPRTRPRTEPQSF